MSKTAIYPGSFDPITYGHIEIVKRATEIFDHVIVAVATNVHKKPLFSTEERVEMLNEAFADSPYVEVDSFGGLSVEYARSKGANVLLRGLRMVSDFEYEFQMALTNRRLASDVETVYLMPSEGYSFLSSKLIKEGVLLGADTKDFVPDFVAKRLKEKLFCDNQS